jgi:hypothetical protein
MLTNISFKDHLFKLEMVLARLSTAGKRVNISKSKVFSVQIEYLGKRYTTIEREQELLSAIKTGKEYKNIMLG